MRNVQANINGQSYYFTTGFETRSYIGTALQNPRMFDEEGNAINPGKFALGVLRVAGAEHRPEIDWAAFVEGLPPVAYDEVWDAVNAILEVTEAEGNTPSQGAAPNAGA